ncbi:hypothetical protein [Caldisericum sp.]|uniref:hypothetical protein n=1 Tax=Caldisericum sp. TaxID=2499687 RepID=UPI003D0A8092
MKTLIVFDIPRCKSGKRLRTRMLRKFAKQSIYKLQDSVWDISSKETTLTQILADLNELKNSIKNETKTEPKIFILKGKIEKL